MKRKQRKSNSEMVGKTKTSAGGEASTRAKPVGGLSAVRTPGDPARPPAKFPEERREEREQKKHSSGQGFPGTARDDLKQKMARTRQIERGKLESVKKDRKAHRARLPRPKEKEGVGSPYRKEARERMTRSGEETSRFGAEGKQDVPTDKRTRRRTRTLLKEGKKKGRGRGESQAVLVLSSRRGDTSFLLENFSAVRGNRNLCLRGREVRNRPLRKQQAKGKDKGRGIGEERKLDQGSRVHRGKGGFSPF